MSHKSVIKHWEIILSLLTGELLLSCFASMLAIGKAIIETIENPKWQLLPLMLLPGLTIAIAFTSNRLFKHLIEQGKLYEEYEADKAAIDDHVNFCVFILLIIQGYLITATYTWFSLYKSM